MTLTEFLLARFAEDSATASAAHEQWPGPWDYDERRGEVWHSGDNGAYDRPFVCNADGHLADEHIARFNPARVLVECEAKRRIVDRATYMGDAEDRMGGYADEFLSLLAMPYADHPDFDPSWRTD